MQKRGQKIFLWLKAVVMLDKLVLQVQPIMRKRQLTCPLVKEFYPRNPVLVYSYSPKTPPSPYPTSGPATNS